MTVTGDDNSMKSPEDEMEMGTPATAVDRDAAGERETTERPVLHRLLAAFIYGLSSIVIMITNKLVLTSQGFPSYLSLALGQMVMGLVLLILAKLCRCIRFPNPSMKVLLQVWPLPLFYFGSMVFGLGGTKSLSLPMLTVLRRFTNLFIMIAEYLILGVVATPFVQFTVFLMIFGAVVAASNDMAFDFVGYAFVFCANVCTCLNGVFTKKKLDAKELGQTGLMFYNSLVMVVPAFLLTYYTGEIDKALAYESWGDSVFMGEFLLSCVMGFVLNYSIILSTHYNSALTTSIIGVIKNLFVTYVGMFIGGDYIFSMVNFIGINISVAGSLMYTYITFRQKPKASPVSKSLPPVS